MLSYKQYCWPTSAALNLTDDCNLACRYCFVEQHPKYMTLKIAKKAIKWLHKNLLLRKKYKIIPYDKCHICFFGGEPLLQYNQIIQPLINYVEEKYPQDFIFTITTNGTLLDQEKINFFKKHAVSILLSIDGVKEVQDYNRPCKNSNLSSFDLVAKNIPYLLSQYPFITFRGTISQDKVEHIFETYLFAEKCGFKSIFLMPDHRSTWPKEKIEILKKELQKIFIYRINQFNNGIAPLSFQTIDAAYDIIIKHDIDITLNQNFYQQKIDNPLLRCGLGTLSVSIGYDGTIYACQEQPSKQKKNIFKIGNIFFGINIFKHIYLLKTYLQTIKNDDQLTCSNATQCDNCLIKGYCYTLGCPSTSFDLYHNLNTINEIRCIWIQEICKNCRCEMKILTEKENSTFRSYLTNHASFYRLYFAQEEK